MSILIEHRFRAASSVFAALLFLIVSMLAVPTTARADSAEYLAKAFSAEGGSARSDRASRSARSSERASSRTESDAKPKRKSSVQLASYGGSFESKPKPQRSLSGGGGSVSWLASASCLNSTLRSAVNAVSQYGRVVVNSTCRSASHNRRVGGASRSHHLTGDAADIRIHGNYGAAYSYLRSAGLGGVKHYGGGLFHIDTGPKRSW